MIAKKTKPCFRCGEKNTVYNSSDRCVTCQRKDWLDRESIRVMLGKETVGFLPPVRVFDIDNGRAD